MTAVLDYVVSLYKPDADEFEKFLLYLEDDAKKDEAAKEALEKYKILNDPILPEEVKQIVYYGFVHRFNYADPANVPQVVEKGEKRPKIDYHLLTSYIIKKFCVVTFKKIIYTYLGGMFKEDEGLISKEIERILILQGVADKRKIRDTVNEVLARIQWRTFFTEFPFNQFGRQFIPVKNGVIYRGNSYILLPHSPAFGYTYRLPVKYNPEAKCPKIEKFISEVVEEENQKVLYEIPASCLLQSSEYHISYMLVGSGRNGKSTYLKLLQALLGYENISNVGLQEICEDKFKTAQLVGKLANIYADIPKKAINYTGKFKMLTGGDRITAERKYKDPFEFVNTARLIFSANEMPSVNDRTYAFWSRWVLIKFPYKFPPNPNLIDELTTEEELSGFLNKVLQALSEIEIRGLTKTKLVEDTLEEWMRRSDPVYAFAKDCLVEDKSSFVIKDDVYQAYRKYCEENELKILDKNVFGRVLPKHIQTKGKKETIEGKRVYVWDSIRLSKKGMEYLTGEKAEDSEDSGHEKGVIKSLGDYEDLEDEVGKSLDLDEMLRD